MQKESNAQGVAATAALAKMELAYALLVGREKIAQSLVLAVVMGRWSKFAPTSLLHPAMPFATPKPCALAMQVGLDRIVALKLFVQMRLALAMELAAKGLADAQRAFRDIRVTYLCLHHARLIAARTELAAMH